MIRPTRRDVLRLVGLGAGRLALGCGDNLEFRAPGPHDAGIVLEPTAQSLLLALASATAQRATLEVQLRGELVRELDIELVGGLATIDIDGLAPSERYDLVVHTNTGVRIGPFRGRTAPSDDDPRPVRIAVSADIDPNNDFETAITDAMIDADPELFVSLGDFPYTDNGPVAMTPAEYRARHLQVRTHPRLRRWLEAITVRAIYDDHEFHNDWDRHFVLAEPARYVAAMQTWDEMFPLRAATEDVRYRSWRWGAHLECFLLDCRRFRDDNAAPDVAGKTMLGPTQLAWLIDGVTRSTAAFKLVFTSVPLDFGIGLDHWSGFTHERQAMFDALVGVRGLLFVSADQHYFAIHNHAYGIREFQVGPLRRGLGTPGRDAPGVLYRKVTYNFGLIEVDADSLHFTAVDADGEYFYKERLSADQLTPR